MSTPELEGITPNFVPDSLPPESEVLVSEQFKQTADRVIAGVINHIQTGEGPVEAILQPDARSEKEEAERDEFVRRLSESFGVDVDTRLTNAEMAWKARGNNAVVVESWMKKALGMNDPEKQINAPGIRRETLLHVDDNNQGCWLSEVEVQTKHRQADDKVVDRFNRIIYFVFEPVLHSRNYGSGQTSLKIEFPDL